MSEAKNILDWYDNYEPEKHGLDPLIKARRKLSIVCTKIAEELKAAEINYFKTYQLRKLKEREDFLSLEGSAAIRSVECLNEELRLKEAKFEGEKRGIKHVLDSYGKVLDSMASQINVLNR